MYCKQQFISEVDYMDFFFSIYEFLFIKINDKKLNIN